MVLVQVSQLLFRFVPSLPPSLPPHDARSLASRAPLVAFIMHPLAQVASLVTEKQRGLKDLMTVSGLSPSIYTASWMFAETLASFVLALVLALLARATEILAVNGVVSFFQVFGLLWLYLSASAALSFLLAASFSRASTAATATFLIYVGAIVVFMVCGLQQDRKNRALGCEDWYETWGWQGKLGYCNSASDLCADWWITGGGDDDDVGGGDDDDVDDGSDDGAGRADDGFDDGYYASEAYTSTYVLDTAAMPATCAELVAAVGSAGVCTGGNALREMSRNFDDEFVAAGYCPVHCDDCKKKDLRLLEGFTTQEHEWMCVVPTWALMMVVVGFDQGKPPLPIGVVLRFLFFDVFLFLFAGWYLSEVFPGELGTPRKRAYSKKQIVTVYATALSLYLPTYLPTNHF